MESDCETCVMKSGSREARAEWYGGGGLLRDKTPGDLRQLRSGSGSCVCSLTKLGCAIASTRLQIFSPRETFRLGGLAIREFPRFASSHPNDLRRYRIAALKLTPEAWSP